MDSNTIREKIQEIFARHGLGDLPDRPYRRAMAVYTAKLYTAVAQERLAAGESILQEHHIIQSHMALTQSVLKDPEQEMISLFATEQRLIRLRSILTPGRPVTCDRRDRTVVDDLSFDDIDAIRVHRKVRAGEALVGLCLAGLSYLFYNWLDVTGPISVGLGLLGMLHGLLLPTRWIELEAAPRSGGDPFIIYAARKKSGRKLLRMIRHRMRFALTPLSATG